MKSVHSNEVKSLHPSLHASTREDNKELLISLINHPSIAFNLKLDAVEVYGACLALKDQNLVMSALHWNVVTVMRNRDKTNIILQNLSSSILTSLVKEYRKAKDSKPFHKLIVPFRRAAYSYELEFQTIEDLLWVGAGGYNSHMVQAALIIERLIGLSNNITFSVTHVLASVYMAQRKSCEFIALVTDHLSFYASPGILQTIGHRYSINKFNDVFRYLSDIVCLLDTGQQLDFRTMLTVLECVYIMAIRDNILSVFQLLFYFLYFPVRRMTRKHLNSKNFFVE